MKRLLFVVALFCGVAHGQLVLVGGCAATATSCTPVVIGGGVFATGQFQYTFAYRSATTAPTLPGTFTALDTASASVSSFRSGCLVMTSSTPDASVWTNAVRVMTLVFSGSPATTTANCVTAGVGFHTSAGASGTTSTYTFTGGTLTHTDGSSFVIGAVGSSAATCIPASLTSRETTTDGIIADAESVSTFVTATCTGTAGNWKTDTVELLAGTVATPTSSPGAGTYGSSQSVTLLDSTSGAAIVYCTDSLGTCTPSTSYTVAITISCTAHVRAKATKTGLVPSAVLDDLYTISGCVTFTSSATSGEVSGTSATTGSITVSGTTPVLVVGISQNTTGTVSGVTFSVGGTAARVIRVVVDVSGFSELWCIPNAPAGTGTVNATFSGTGDTYVVAALFNGANSTTPCPAGDAKSIADTATDTSTTLTPTNLAASDASVGMVGLYNSGDVGTPWVQANDIYHNIGGTSDAEMGYSTGATGVTGNWASGSTHKAFTAIRVAASGAAPPASAAPKLLMMNVGQ